ncbi:glutamate synthase subunit beta [Kitasatospora sp. NBC_01287]|uniref:glutamate synthase subunit beta n=1 Tax=Kitasatospora sp. NBC_01287 TaxID=2903573 RepID=UPI00225AF0EB|nr:glutamate synthase subunit beta [Kitasatospora sp. NBC_01287]MCX4744148.1 glutamate synthase subunit beta [Kitasatospora sp. NBC_01287]
MADPMAFFSTPRQERARRTLPERAHDSAEVYRPRALLPIVGTQATRCMDCGLPFCHRACPLGNLIPEWNQLVAADDWQAAAHRLAATNNFPEFTGRLCPAPCESACVLAIDGEPVTIKNIELAIADRAWEDGCEGPRPPAHSTGRTVAVVGSGPAGLAAAQQLTRAGHAVTVYESADRPGGLLRYGIPDFRLEKHRLDRRIGQLRAEGTRFCTGVRVGEDLAADLLRESHDALVIATGAPVCRELEVPGREFTGIRQAMEYLPLANRVAAGDLGGSPLSARGCRVVVIGGGDTAADCVGTALRQHALDIQQVDINPRPPAARSTAQPWPVHAKVYRETTSHEEANALHPEDDGIRTFAATTVAFEGDRSGHVTAVRLARTASGGRRPVPGSESALPADLVLLALGFRGPDRSSRLVRQLGLPATADGALARDHAFASPVDGVFIAGDAGRGQSLIVWAIAEGRSAAAAVHRYLTGSDELPAPITPQDGAIAAEDHGGAG